MFCRYGWVKVVVRDNGSEFKNKLNDAVCKRLRTEARPIRVRHPQSNGAAEGAYVYNL